MFNLGDIIKTLDFVALAVNFLALNLIDILKKSWFIICVCGQIWTGKN